MPKLLDAIASIAMMAGLATGGAASAAIWPSAGQDLTNAHNQPLEFQIGPGNVANLKVKWSVSTSGDVVALPALDEHYAYFPDSAGFIYKVSRATGAVVWKFPVSNYTGVAGDYARSTPAIWGDTLVFGNQSGKFVAAFGQPAPQPAQVFAVNKDTGAKLWSTQVDPDVLSAVTAAPLVAQGLVLVGVASNEELLAGFVPPPNWKFNFRGSVVALDVNTGAIRWQTYTVPPGYFGGAVWGSTIAVDVLRQEAYAATGNNYAVPQSVLDCLNQGGAPTSCLDPNDHFDSVIGLSLADGHITWSHRGLPYDAFNTGCGLIVPYLFTLPPNANCPNPAGPDWDFAQGPILLGGPLGSFFNGHIAGGEKSGVVWSFDRSTGKVDWMTQVAPGGQTGGLQWGSATDGARIYVAASNSGPTGSGLAPAPWTLANGSTVKSGGWAAVDARTGKVIWTTPDPNGSRAEAPVSVANGVVFGCNLDPGKGTMFALNAATGAVLWSHDSGGACEAGASIADGVVYWGSGNYQGIGPHTLTAFSLGGN